MNKVFDKVFLFFQSESILSGNHSFHYHNILIKTVTEMQNKKGYHEFEAEQDSIPIGNPVYAEPNFNENQNYFQQPTVIPGNQNYQQNESPMGQPIPLQQRQPPQAYQGALYNQNAVMPAQVYKFRFRLTQTIQ